jgi:16S rRNA (adenine1518-N6/adenine1519-N6)-dimethyltransferase
MIPRKDVPVCDGAALEEVVTKAFTQRRKVIRNCLSGMFTEEELLQAGADPQARPETISLDVYVALANLWSQKTPKS